MRVLVCDDDALFARQLTERLQGLLKGIERNTTVDCVVDPTTLKDEDLLCYDIAFLDIDMGQTNGIQLGIRLHQQRADTVLIFVTNYVEYGIDGYEAQAFRYLLKSEIEQKLERYVRQAVSACLRERPLIRISSESEDIDLRPEWILYVGATPRRSILHLRNYSRDTLATRTSLNGLEEMLEPRGFLRVHKSFLVNMAFLQKLQNNRVWLSDGIELPVSTHRYSKVKQDYLRWKGRKRWSIG